jgi:hypothetical protein
VFSCRSFRFDPQLVDRAVAEGCGQRLVHAPVLVEEGEAVEVGRCDDDLEVIARPGPILDRELGRAGERLREDRADRVGLHASDGSGGTLDADAPPRPLPARLPDAPTLKVEGLAGFGGIAIGAKADD